MEMKTFEYEAEMRVTIDDCLKSCSDMSCHFCTAGSVKLPYARSRTIDAIVQEVDLTMKLFIVCIVQYGYRNAMVVDYITHPGTKLVLTFVN